MIFSLKGVYACTNRPPICPPNCPSNPIFAPFSDL
nr:MAG TPA: conotoxin [Caudoviricetes sp.]